jgi:hypothetical protein
VHKRTFLAVAIATLVICGANLSAAQIVVAKGKVLNHTTPIAQRTFFTPTSTGLYGLSVYGTVTVADPNSTSEWSLTIAWTDDSDVINNGCVMYASGNRAGSFGNFIGSWGDVCPIEVKAGTPITVTVSQTGSPDKSAYSLYWTLEQLE